MILLSKIRNLLSFLWYSINGERRAERKLKECLSEIEPKKQPPHSGNAGVTFPSSDSHISFTEQPQSVEKKPNNFKMEIPKAKEEKVEKKKVLQRRGHWLRREHFGTFSPIKPL